MNIHEEISAISNKVQFADFISRLSKELESDDCDWENTDLKNFLTALCAFTRDSREVEFPNWSNFAKILTAATIYS